MSKIECSKLNNLNDGEILNLRLCDLELEIAHTELQGYINQLYKELKEKGLSFFPECYFADEWLCPDGEPVIGIPFYLAHFRLKKLEEKFMGEVEGDTKSSCMALLRHETGHAYNYAYLLHRRKKWRQLFGPFSADYPERYRFRPYSKSFVRHLDDYYAQYHPDEDFAETFAVWLDPNSNWKEKYKGWKALEKLEYIDKLMNEIKGKQPLIKKGKKYWAINKSKLRLSNYYKRKREFYSEDYPDFHDPQLKKIFSSIEKSESKVDAASFIKKYRKQLLDTVSFWTKEKKYVVKRILKDLSKRSSQLNLYISGSEIDTISKITTYITSLIMTYIYTGRFKKRR